MCLNFAIRFNKYTFNNSIVNLGKYKYKLKLEVDRWKIKILFLSLRWFYDLSDSALGKINENRDGSFC